MDKLLNLFIGDDELRPWMNKPFFQDGFTYSSDAHIAIAIPQNLGYEVLEKPNIGRVFTADNPCNILVDIEEIKATMNINIPNIEEVITKYTNCVSCNGEGGEECNLDHWHDCEDCDGDGEITSKHKTGKMVKSSAYFCDINGSLYATRYVSKMIEACEMLGITKMELISSAPTRAGIFKHQLASIVIMPVLKVEQDEFKIKLV